LRLAALLAAAAGALALPAVASGAAIDVTTTADEFGSGSRCSLREAIWSANNDSNGEAVGCTAGSGLDVINVPGGTFRLTSGGLDVTAPASILHTGITPAIVRGSLPPHDHVFQVHAANVVLEHLTITGGALHSPFTPSPYGGGILNEGGGLTVRASLIQGNQADYGGGIATIGAGSTTLVNSTVAGNESTYDGGGIDVETGASTTLLSTTIVSNTTRQGNGGGVSAASSGGGGTVQMRNTLLADNDDNGGEAPDCVELGGSITSTGNSLIGLTAGCDYTAGPGDVTNKKPVLLKLVDNGGPTMTRAVRKWSPAIDHGRGCPSTDQRGVKRGLGGKRCDIGAWELARCQGVVVNRVGTAGIDLLEGTSTADGMLGLGGDDVLHAAGGNDGLCGGGGNDRLEGGPLNDRLDGGPGRDTCLGAGGTNATVHCELPRSTR
jgi:CSLREA domain-containing protein